MKTDQELLDDIKAAQEVLERAINAALKAKLNVVCCVDSCNTYNVRWDLAEVRTLKPTATRKLV